MSCLVLLKLFDVLEDLSKMITNIYSKQLLIVILSVFKKSKIVLKFYFLFYFFVQMKRRTFNERQYIIHKTKMILNIKHKGNVSVISSDTPFEKRSVRSTTVHCKPFIQTTMMWISLFVHSVGILYTPCTITWFL